MKIIFMGTPDFAACALDALCADGRDVILAVSQPDRQKGRGRKVIPTPVHVCADKCNVPVFQPARIREPGAIEKIRALAPDLIIVAAFGQILPQELLDIPRLGCVNIHASLLPRLRGAAPIQWSIINGDAETGITLMQMDAGMDTGDILFQERIPIAPDETGESLYEKLARLGGEMIVRYLPAIEKGEIHPVRQDMDSATYAPMLRKEMGEIDWALPAAVIEQRMRGMLPWPGAFTKLNGHVLKVWQAKAQERAGEAETDGEPAPGTVVSEDQKAIRGACGDGILALVEVQAEGKKRMGTDAFLRGTKVPAGTVLG